MITNPPSVIGPRFIYEPPGQVDFLNTQGGRVECTAHGQPQPTVRWIKSDGTPVTDVDDILTVLPNGTLVFPPFADSSYSRDTHASVYVCMASNSAGAIRSRNTRVNAVIQRTSYFAEVDDQYVVRGITAVFKCKIKGIAKDYVTVTQWTQGASTITANERFSILDNGELHIRHIRDADSIPGYRCTITNKLTNGVKTSDEAKLFVYDPTDSAPEIVSSLASKTATMGDTVELPCVSVGYPQPSPAYVWKKNGRTVTLTDRVQLLGGNLLITNVSLSEAGRYTCSAENGLGQASIQTVLTVVDPLKVFFDIQHQVIDVGSPAYFNCSVSGYPIGSITWLKNGQQLVEDERIFISDNDTMMIIDQVSRHDKGMYQCVVEYRQNSVEATVQLSIGAALPIIIESFEEQFLQPGPNVQLTCVVAGNPTPNVTWTLDGQPLVENGRVGVGEWINEDGDVTSHVNITGLRVMDGGLWRCQATSQIGDASHEARINVYGTPYVRPMANITAVAGRDLVMHCRVAGYPLDVIEWRKDEESLPTNLRQEVFSNGTLIVANIEKGRDEGEYVCTARNSQGQGTRRKVFITVKVPPEIDPFDFPPMLRQGDRTQVLCVVSKGDMPITISWEKDGHPVPPGIGISITNTGFSSTLSISDVSMVHQGNYTCVVSNDAASISYNSELIVLVPPRFDDIPQDSSVVVDYSVTIPCSAAGTPTPIIQWKKALGPGPSNFIPLPPDPRYKIEERGSLTINLAGEVDDGYYLCHISSDVGSDSKTAKLTVYIPAYFETQQETIMVRKSETVAMTCVAKGHQTMTIDWKKDGVLYTRLATTFYSIQTRHIDNQHTQSTLEVYETRRENSGNYTCNAENPYGTDVKTIELIIQESPETPSNLTIISRSSRSVIVSWKPEFDGNSPLTGFTLEYKNDSDAWQGGLPNARAEFNQTTYSIEGLHPYYTYNIRIYAFNAIGVSQPSQDTIFTTLEEAPTGPPLNIELEATGSQTVLLRWRQPRADLQNGILQGYYIGYKEFNTTDPYLYSTVNVETRNIETYTLRKLKKFTKYSIVIQSFNNRGAGPASPPQVILTLEDVPSQPPQMVQATALSSTSIMLVWGPPPLQSLNGILQGYWVIYKPVTNDEDETQTHTQETKALRANIYGLQKFRNYSITVLAYTRMGEGVRSEPIFIRTQQDVPEEPADVKAHSQSPTSVMLSWLPPLYPNGIITKYTVYTRYKEGNTEMTEELVLAPPPVTLYHTITNLQTNYEYDFWVTASTIVGEGIPSRIVTEILLQRVAARIASFPLILTTPWKQDVEIPCVAVGDPIPTVEWRRNRLTTAIEPTDHLQLYQNGSLYITGAQPLDAGNYTCRAHNHWGTDEILVQLKVQAPPKSPRLSVSLTTVTSIQLNWTSGSNGGSPIKGFRLHYKRDHGSWERVILDSKERSYRLGDLICGTPYKFYLVAFNMIGDGDSSSIIETTTAGSAPIAPHASQFVKEVNSTSVTVYLKAWQSGGCQITSFTIQYQFNGQPDWNLVANEVPSSDDFTIHDLRPATHYIIRVTAYNAAGPSTMESTVATLKYDGSTIPPIIVHLEAHKNGLLFYEDPRIMGPIFGGITILVVTLIVTIMGYRRSRRRWKAKNAKKISNLAALAAQGESGAAGFSRQNSLKRNFTDPPSQAAAAAATATSEQEPFLSQPGVTLNNSPSGESSDSRPEAERSRPWVYSPVQLDENRLLASAAAAPPMLKESPDSSPEMTRARPSGTITLSTFQSSNPNSEESIYASGSDEGSSGLHLREACYAAGGELAACGTVSPHNHTYASLDDVLESPPVPKRPKDLYVPQLSGTFIKHRGTPLQERHRHSIVSSGTTSSAQEELSQVLDNAHGLRTDSEHATPRSTPQVPPEYASQSDMDIGIRHFTASPPLPYVPERKDSNSSYQPSNKNPGSKPILPGRTRKSGDASGFESPDHPPVAIYRPPRYRAPRRQQKKGAHVIGRPVIRATRGPIRRQRRPESSCSSSSSNNSPTEDLTYTASRDMSSPSEGYLSYQCDSRAGTLGSGGLVSGFTDSDAEPIQSRRKSHGGSVSEPEKSRRLSTPSTFKPRPITVTPIPTVQYAVAPKDRNMPRHRPHTGSSGEPSDESPLTPTTPSQQKRLKYTC
ncbi:cell adhesion molecule DSCAM-like [Saccoglossus kowalevskii]|uniref:Down syndrome cell adhesion molecule-like n=1 Tax=Saccoglossus kowalevskii TaxID=10224 RepID=A0ABM0N0S8_SACKO|nr:PREDICTED: Down syndrome cell adhesion molecule-like [Saccoglossus kowalevskii]